jgi:hypothetical protein
VVAEPVVFGLVFVAAELSPEVVVLVAELSLDVLALVFVAAELSPEIVVWAAEPEVSELGVVSVAEPEVSEPGVVSVAEPQASVDIAAAFVALVPIFVVVVGLDNSGRPKFLAFPNVEHFASSSNSVEVVG